jgi:hypothetical protein
LRVGPAALQSVIDRSWSRRYRWSAFQVIAKLAESHSANGGELSTLIQMYVEQNALQPYTDGPRRDDRLWVQLGIAADQLDFIGFISRYATEHPGTKVTVTLLFLLDTLATASLDNLSTLMGTDPIVDLRWTKNTSPAAFATLAAVHQYYQAQLHDRQLDSVEAITKYFQGVQLSILQHIIRSTPLGFRSNDARFLNGTILWSQRRETEALQMWREMTGGDGEGHYSESSALLRPALGAPGGPIDRREIDRILAREQARWLSLSFNRLRQFGYRFDTY